MNQSYKKYFYFLLFVVICSIGDALFFKAGVGVSPFEAVAQTGEYITHIEVGYIAIIINVVFIILQILLSKKLNIKILLQIVMCLIQGNIVNLIIYTVLSGIQFNYIASLICLLVSICFQAIGVGLLMSLDLVVFPLEGFCNELSKVIHVNFAKLRQGADVLFIVSCLACSFFLHLPYAIREGTVVAMFIFAPIMAFVMKKMDPFVKKINQ